MVISMTIILQRQRPSAPLCGLGSEARSAIAEGERDYPWDDDALRSAWQTELDLLAAALRTESDSDASGAIREFLELRDQRRAMLTPEQIDYERQREWTEGLAKYVELTIWRAADQASECAPVAALARDGDFHDYGSADRKWSQEIDQMRRMAGDHGDGRFYYSGMAQAALLDRVATGWTSRRLLPEVFQEDLLREAVSVAAVPPQ